MNIEYPSRMSSVVFWSENHPLLSHKVRLFWAGLYWVMKLIAPALAEIKPVYYPRKERVVSLDVLKLYRGEDVICQNPKDIDQKTGEGRSYILNQT